MNKIRCPHCHEVITTSQSRAQAKYLAKKIVSGICTGCTNLAMAGKRKCQLCFHKINYRRRLKRLKKIA